MKLIQMMTGSVLLLTALPVSAQTINEVFKLVAADSESNFQLGYSVAVSETTAIVGTPYGNSFNYGAAYLFDIETGQQLFRLTQPNPGYTNWFGSSVAISGNRTLVGAEFYDGSELRSGAAFLFDTKTGNLIRQFNPPPENATYFGTSVDISDTTIIVGAPHDHWQYLDHGSAYLYDIESGNLLFALSVNTGRIDRFGCSVAISENLAIVGATGYVHPENGSGAAFIYDTTSGQLLFTLDSTDPLDDVAFGRSVSISGTTAIVGAPNDDEAGTNSGAAYIFDASTGLQLWKIVPSDASDLDAFGQSVAVSDTRAIIGAIGNDGYGSVYVFDIETGLQIAKLTGSDRTDWGQLGGSVAIHGNSVISGDIYDNDIDSFAGSAYLFSLPACLGNPANLNSDDNLDFFDISAFLTAFANMDPIADFTGDGLWDFSDISAFLTAFSAGCP